MRDEREAYEEFSVDAVAATTQHSTPATTPLHHYILGTVVTAIAALHATTLFTSSKAKRNYLFSDERNDDINQRFWWICMWTCSCNGHCSIPSLARSQCTDRALVCGCMFECVRVFSPETICSQANRMQWKAFEMLLKCIKQHQSDTSLLRVGIFGVRFLHIAQFSSTRARTHTQTACFFCQFE